MIFLLIYLYNKKKKESKNIKKERKFSSFVSFLKNFFIFAVSVFVLGLNYKNLYQNIGITVGISIFIYIIIIFLKRRFGSGSVILYAKEHKFLKKVERKFQCQVARVLGSNFDKISTLILKFFIRIYTNLLWFSENFDYEIVFNLKRADYKTWIGCIQKKKDIKLNIIEYKKNYN